MHGEPDAVVGDAIFLKLYVLIFSDRSPLPTIDLRSAESSSCCRCSSSSCRRARKIRIAFSLFLICDFSSCIETTTFVGRCVRRTAEYVVLTDWPPGPEEQK